MKKIFTIYIASTLSVGLFTGCFNQTIGKKNVKITSQARHKATMKPYIVLGQPYEPTFIGAGEKMKGISSWYGPTFHGKYTSNGEIYDMNDMTAAHKTWPMDTMVRVQNHDNGKSVVVRINDRGPFVNGRIIDCSYSAGKAIGLDKAGIANVTITALSFKSKLEGAGQMVKVTQPVKIPLNNFSIQVGAFKNPNIAQNAKSRYANLDSKKVVKTKSSSSGDGQPIYRVFIDGFDTEAEAKDFIVLHNLDTKIIIRG